MMGEGAYDNRIYGSEALRAKPAIRLGYQMTRSPTLTLFTGSDEHRDSFGMQGTFSELIAHCQSSTGVFLFTGFSRSTRAARKRGVRCLTLMAPVCSTMVKEAKEPQEEKGLYEKRNRAGSGTQL